MRGAVAPRGLQLQHDLPGGVALHALVGQRRARDGAAQLLERLAVVGAAAYGGVQAEPVDVGAQALFEARLPWYCALQRQQLLAGARAERNAVSTGRGLQRPEHAGLVRVAVSHVGGTLLFDQYTPTGEQLASCG